MSGQSIIFFDGVCGLCDRFINWVIKHDQNHKFHFTPLQGQTSKEELGDLPDDVQEWSVVFKNEEGIFVRSDAVLKILGTLGGGWSWTKIFFIVPRVCRDALYDFVAKRRYKWYGKRSACRVPTPDEKEKFLP